MNTNLIAGHLQYLRKRHHYTQEDLAKRLHLSRQAVSKWETGATIPDLEILLQLSSLYDISINDILEPDIQPRMITDFEQLSAIPEKELEESLRLFDEKALVTALMGASPGINDLCEKLFPAIAFEKIRNDIGRIRIEEVEKRQKEIISMINLRELERRGEELLFAVPCSLLLLIEFHRNCIFPLFMASLSNEKETRLSRVTES